jgi:hypothetical protein
MLEPVRHRQTKGAATDMFVLPPPRHTPTLPTVRARATIARWPNRAETGRSAPLPVFDLKRRAYINHLHAARLRVLYRSSRPGLRPARAGGIGAIPGVGAVSAGDGAPVHGLGAACVAAPPQRRFRGAAGPRSVAAPVAPSSGPTGGGAIAGAEGAATGGGAAAIGGGQI